MGGSLLINLSIRFVFSLITSPPLSTEVDKQKNFIGVIYLSFRRGVQNQILKDQFFFPQEKIVPSELILSDLLWENLFSQINFVKTSPLRGLLTPEGPGPPLFRSVRRVSRFPKIRHNWRQKEDDLHYRPGCLHKDIASGET